MATDPVRRVRSRAHETALDLDAAQALQRFAAMPPSEEAPYLTVYLDWRPEGDDPGRLPAPELRRSQRHTLPQGSPVSRRPSRRQVQRELDAVIAAQGPRGAALDSLRADAERLSSYLDDGLDPSARGAIVVACAHRDVFETLALGLPVPTQLVASPTPALVPLAYLVDDHPTYAVLVADQHDATVMVIDQATPRHSVALESNDYPRRQATGGVSYRRYKARADERIAAFARAIAEETQRALDEDKVGMLVVAGAQEMAIAVDAVFHATVKERVVSTIRLDTNAPEQEVVEATLPLVAKAELEREAQAVEALRHNIGVGERGAAGAEDTLLALQARQVGMLLMVNDFQGVGWADYRKPVFGAGPVPAQHPTGGDLDALLPIALEAEMVRLAAQTGAEIQIIHTSVPVDAGAALPEVGAVQPRTEAARLLDELGGVGALLRY